MVSDYSLANKLANIDCGGRVLLDRTRVYKKREKDMKKRMLEAYSKGGRAEAYPYAMGVLMIKAHNQTLLDTAKKIQFFFMFSNKIFAGNDTDKKKMLKEILTKIESRVTYGTVNEIKNNLILFAEAFEINMPERKIPKLTRRNAWKEMYKVIPEANKHKKKPAKEEEDTSETEVST